MRPPPAPKPAQAARGASPSGDRLELIETFIRIAETGGISAAARSLGTAQPTVTRRLQQLESLLGGKLVERGNQGLALTTLGARMLPEAREMAARWSGLAEIALAQGSEAGAALAGRVRIASTRAIGSAFLPAIIADFLAAHPDMRIDLRLEDGGADLGADLAADGADFALRLGKACAPGETRREIARVRRALCASPETAERVGFARGVDISRCEPLSLEGEPLIVLGAKGGSMAASLGGSMGTGGMEALRFFGRDGESMEARFEALACVDDVEAALDLALSGVGLALLPTWRIAPLLQEGALIPVSAAWTEGETPVSVVWPSGRFRSAAATALLDQVTAELSAILGES
ncbi:MAG: LysR family transcriptional regulator [Pseudomonadota bacterium]